jgi:hypothetical protein
MNNITPIELSIVMPCLNEELTLAVCINKAKAFFSTQHINGEIIIADNGSTDRSIGIASAAGATVVPVAEKGYGSALMGGIQAAQGTYVIMGDADDSYDFSDLSLFLERLRAGDELVMGNRFKGGIKPGAMPFLHRYLGNPVLSFIGRLFFKSNIGDFHCGLRGFNRQAILNLNLKTTGMEFASEMVVKASIKQLKIAEVPTILHPDGRNRPPHLRTWRDGWRHLIFLLMFSPRWLFLYPGLALTLMGCLGLLFILPGPLTIGKVVLDIHTLLLASTAIIMGVQTLFAFLLAKQFTLKFGLLVEEPSYVTWFNKRSLEFLLVSGGCAILIGGGCVLYSVSFWQQQAFGQLEPGIIMRLLVPGITLLIVGFQTIITGFLRAILNLPVHR